MELLVKIPNTYPCERDYILSLLFHEFLGLDIHIIRTERSNVQITMDDGCELIIADGLFATPQDKWLRPESLPSQPLKIWDMKGIPVSANTVALQLPVIFGRDPAMPDFFEVTEKRINLGLDIFGSCFFMLTRYEEIIKPDSDEHGRFPAVASLSYKDGFLDRPVVNEYLEILWACLKHLCPGLKRKPRHFQTYISHDVDDPFKYAFCGFFSTARRCIGDIFIRRVTGSGFNRIKNWFKVKTGDESADPYNIYNDIIDIDEKHGLRSAFYFIAGHSVWDKDGCYSLKHPLIREMLRNIHQRGHEIGLHTSYNTCQDAAQTKREFEALKQACAQEEITQKYWGVRQHYLRCKIPATFQNWHDAGLDYDTTLSFADAAGFRCGVCYEFPLFNVLSRQTLKTRERPLIVMESTVIDKCYMNLGLSDDRALQYIVKLKQRCQQFNGDFTLLWHNTRLVDKREMALYQQALNC